MVNREKHTAYIFCFAIVGIALGVASHHLYTDSQPVSQTCEQRVKLVTGAKDAFLLGQSYFNGDRGHDLYCAQLAYEQAIEFDPEVDPWLWHQAGRVDFIRGRFYSALYKFDQQIKYFGDEVPNVHYMIGLTHGYRARESGSMYDWKRAEEGFIKYLELDPESPWARTDLAWVYFAQGKYEEMKPVLEEGLSAQPSHPWLLNMYGLALLNTDRKEEAHSHFVQASVQASSLTVEEWGRAYPGNHPDSWPVGLAEMRAAIEKNITLSVF